MLGKKGNFAVEWCRVFNRVAFALGALAKVIAHNLAEASRFRRTQPQRPKPILGDRTIGHASERTTLHVKRFTPGATLNSTPAHLRRQ